MSEPESSYYEIALTNRQVLVGFVLLLVCVLAAFVSGVWVGRSSDQPVITAGVDEPAPSDVLAEVAEVDFFDGGDAGEAEPPDLGRLGRGQDAGNAVAEPPISPPPPASPPPPTQQASR
ncbi:MAG: hypothetical protein AAGD38_18510, partial [Acidobacteriota bacterium]